ncbi:MAG: hypothetical protein D3910_25365, partial [Candidatus Electrothrix sp. ATG2]|nr:hypothetical protein [Candidatus Electrothrix sp. ATG2]
PRIKSPFIYHNRDVPADLPGRSPSPNAARYERRVTPWDYGSEAELQGKRFPSRSLGTREKGTVVDLTGFGTGLRL